MLGQLIEARIANVEGLLQVEGAAGFAALRDGDKLRPPQRTPAAFVIVLREDPAGDLRDSGLSVLQDIRYHVAILTCVRVANDKIGAGTNAISDAIRSGIRQQLYGWTPEGYDSPFIRGPSMIFDFAAGAHWHQDEYIIQRLEEPSDE